MISPVYMIYCVLITLVSVIIGFILGRRSQTPAQSNESIFLTPRPGEVVEFEDPYRDAMSDEDEE